DADGYLNRQDNCPLVPNGQESKDQPTGNQHDTDLDGIGDACDPNPNTPDGELPVKTLTADITIGAGGAGGPPTNCPDCEKPTDDPAPKGESLSSAPANTKEDNGSASTTDGARTGRIALTGGRVGCRCGPEARSLPRWDLMKRRRRARAPVQLQARRLALRRRVGARRQRYRPGTPPACAPPSSRVLL